MPFQTFPLALHRHLPTRLTTTDYSPLWPPSLVVYLSSLASPAVLYLPLLAAHGLSAAAWLGPGGLPQPYRWVGLTHTHTHTHTDTHTHHSP